MAFENCLKSLATKNFIMLASIYLITTSVIIICISVFIIKWYFMPNLAFWDQMFSVAPYLLLSVGIMKFCISLFGFYIKSSTNRRLLFFLVVFLSATHVCQMASIITFLGVRHTIEIGKYDSAALYQGAKDELELYGKKGSDAITSSWDRMQTFHQNGKHQRFDGVPESCCHQKGKNCGKGVLGNMGENNIRARIFVNGCLEILQQWMEDDIVPMIDCYVGIGIFMTIIELSVTIVFTFYFCRKYQCKVSKGNSYVDNVRGDTGKAMDAETQPKHKPECYSK